MAGTEQAADDVTELGWFARAALPADVGPSAFAEALSAWRHEYA